MNSHQLLRRIAAQLPTELQRDTIFGSRGDVYMDRIELFELPSGCRVRLHRIARSDEDLELHSHPWDAASLLLAGSYLEERRVGARVEERVLRAGDVNTIAAADYHRLHLDGPVWSLFVTGRKIKSWDFWNRDTGVVTPWRDFIRAKGVAPAAMTEDE